MTTRTSALLLLGLVGGCDKLFSLDDVKGVDGAIDAPPSNYANVVLEDAPLAYFRLGETSGVTALDQVTTGPSGTYIGAVVLGAAGALEADADTAITLDGLTGPVSLGDELDFPGFVPYTLEAWIKPTAFDGDFHTVMSKWQTPAANEGFDFYYQDAELVFTRELGTQTDRLSWEGFFESNVYTHVVGTFDGVYLRLYTNGIFRIQLEAAVPLADTTFPFLLGAGGEPDNAVVIGSLDEVAIYGTALPADRVFAHYEAGVGLR